MRRKAFLFTLGFALLLFAIPVVAHHSFMVEYDLTKPVTLQGVVTKLVYENLHITFFVDVRDASGQTKNWGFEAASPTALRGRGWLKDTVKAGDKVTVEGVRARKGELFGAASVVTMADGRRFVAGSDGVVSPANR